MQWILTEEKEETEHIMCMESGAIWPKIVRKDIKREE